MKIKGWFQHARGWRGLLVLFLLLLILQFVRSYVGTFSIVDGASMYPTFRPNDVVRARTLPTEVERGDVVIVTDDQREQVIKRIIGLPGETVTLYRGFVYIDHQRLTEPYLPKSTYTYKRNQRNEQPESWKLTPDQYFILGDNRLFSADSRHYGPVTRQQILSIVNVPANTLHPGLSDIMLTESGQVKRSKSPQQPAAREHLSKPSATSERM